MTSAEQEPTAPRTYNFEGALRTQRAILDAEFMWYGTCTRTSADIHREIGAPALLETVALDDTEEYETLSYQCVDGEWTLRSEESGSVDIPESGRKTDASS